MPEVRYLDDERYPGPSSHPASEEIKGLPTQAELDAYPRMFTWGDLKEIIVAGRLEDLMRNKEMQARYNIWTKVIKEKYGSTEKYLTQGRLPFPRTTAQTAPEPTYDPRTLDGGPSSPKALSKSIPLPTPDAGEAPSEGGTAADDSSAHEAEYLRYDAQQGLDPEKYAVLPNDWPYNIPYGVRHFCVWSKVPIAHPILVGNDVDKWAQIEEEGLGGFTGVIPTTPPAKPSFDPSCLPSIKGQSQAAILDQPARSFTADGSSSGSSAGTSGNAPHPMGWGATSLAGFGEGAASWYEIDLKFGGTEFRQWAGVEYECAGGQEVGKMVRGLWDQRGWECLWFVNPPRLQSVPGFSHYHVFARRKTPEEIDISEQIWGKA